MVIKVYISGISASQEVKKRQQRCLLILDSVQVDYQPVDITEPGREEERQWVQQTCKERPNPLPPQFFNDDLYLGDYDDFNSAVDINKVLAFLKLDSGVEDVIPAEENHVQAQNGQSESEKGEDKEITIKEEIGVEREEAAEHIIESKAEQISPENDLVNEANTNNDGEDEALMEGDESDRAEEELEEEDEEKEEDED